MKECCCASCGREQKVKLGTPDKASLTCPRCGHAVPIRDGGERLDMANLRSLCRGCHNRKHNGPDCAKMKFL